MWDYLCPSASLHRNKVNILAEFVQQNSEMEIILSIFLTLEVKSYLILINIWEIVRILMISEKSDLGTHSVPAICLNKFLFELFHQAESIFCPSLTLWLCWGSGTSSGQLVAKAEPSLEALHKTNQFWQLKLLWAIITFRLLVMTDLDVN